MADNGRVGGRAGNIIKNSSMGFLTNVLPSMLRFFSRYVFLMYFGDTLLGVNSLFADVVAIFSFAEVGINAAVSYFLYKPIAENDTERIQSFLALYRKLNHFIMAAVTVVGIAFIPFLGFIKTTEPIPGLLTYYLIFLLQNILSYVFSYRMVFITAGQKAYRLAKINICIAFSTEIAQILVTILTQNFTAYLLTYVGMMAVRVLWSNHFIVKNYPETKFGSAKPLDAETIKQFTQKTKSLFVLKTMALGVSQTDSVIVSTMVNVTQWGYVANYLSIKKIITLVLSSLASGLVPSMGNLSVVESKEKQEDSFRLYSFCNAWLCTNIFTCLVMLVPPFITLIFGQKRVLDDLTCFLLFFNVLYNGLLEAVSVLRDAKGLYEKDKWVNVAAFFCNLVTSVLFVLWLGLPGVFIGTLCSTTITYSRIYIVLHEVFGGNCREYYWQAAKAILASLVAYGVLQFLLCPMLWKWQSNIAGFVMIAIVTVLVTNVCFVAANRGDPYFKRSIALALRFVSKKK